MRQGWMFALVAWPGLAMAQDGWSWSDFEMLGMSTDFGTSYLAQPGQSDIWAQRIGLSGAFVLNDSPERPIFLEFGLSRSHGSSQDQSSRSIGSNGPFVFATRVSPNGDVSLNTRIDGSGASATAVVSFTDTSGDSININSTTFSPPGGQTSVFATSPSVSGGAFTSIVTDGTNEIASAVGAFYDDSGAVFLGSGTGGETRMITGRSDVVSFTDATLRLSTVFPINQTWEMTPRLGLLLQRFGRSTTLRNTINVADGFAAAPPTPDFTIAQATNLSTDMTGLSVGMGVSRQLQENWYLSFGADLGAMYRDTHYTSEERVLFGQSQVQTISGPGGSDTGNANLARLSVGLSHQLARGGIVSLNIYSDLITDVPYLERVDRMSPTPTVSGDDTTINVAGQTNQDFRMKYSNLQNTGITIGFLWAF